MDNELQASVRVNTPLPEQNLLSDIGLAAVLRILWRRKTVIGSTILVIVGLMAIYVFTVAPHYMTETVILIEDNPRPVFDMQAALMGQPQDEASVIGEIEIIKSTKIAWLVIKQLGLDKLPEFNDELQEKNPVSDIIKNLLRAVSSGDDMSEQRQEEFKQQRIVSIFNRNLNVKQIPRSRAVLVEFTSKSPEVAADVVNSIAQSYLTARLEYKLEKADRASTWLSVHVNALKDEVERAERAVEEYRKQHGLFRIDRVTLQETQIAELSTRLTDATINRQAAEANLAAARRLLSSQGQKEVETAGEVLKSPLVQRFREQELILELKQAEMGEQLGARHPEMIQLEAERQRVKQALRLEIGKIVSSLQNEVQVARGREEALSRDLQALKVQIAQANQASVGLESLQRNAETKRLLLQKFSTAFMEASAQQDVGSQLPDARIVSRAFIPDRPFFPRKFLMLAIALAGAAVVGVMLTLVLEHLDAGFRSAEEVEEAS